MSAPRWARGNFTLKRGRAPDTRRRGGLQTKGNVEEVRAADEVWEQRSLVLRLHSLSQTTVPGLQTRKFRMTSVLFIF